MFNAYLGDQVDRLVEIAVASGNACRRTYNAPPGVYSIQATDCDEAGFSFSAHALP